MTNYTLKSGEVIKVDILHILSMSDEQLERWESEQLGKHQNSTGYDELDEVQSDFAFARSSPTED